LKQLYTLQQVYKAQNDHYAADLDSLRTVGWEPLPLRHFQQPRVVGGGERFCISVQPRAADLWPMHIDQDGKLGRGASCR
jgi:hypothetical protein